MNFRSNAFTAVLFFLILSAKAQTVTVGLETGVASSNSTEDQITDFSNRRTTYFSGFNISKQISARLSLASGFQYVRQGTRNPAPGCYVYEDEENHYVTQKIDYLTVPLTLNAALGHKERFLVTFGFYGGYNVRAIQDYDEPDWGCALGIVDDVSYWTKKFSFGGIVGAGYRIFSNDKFELTAMAKYYQGISNTEPKIQYLPKSQTRYASALLTVGVNYKIPTKAASAK